MSQYVRNNVIKKFLAGGENICAWLSPARVPGEYVNTPRSRIFFFLRIMAWSKGRGEFLIP